MRAFFVLSEVLPSELDGVLRVDNATNLRILVLGNFSTEVVEQRIFIGDVIGTDGDLAPFAKVIADRSVQLIPGIIFLVACTRFGLANEVPTRVGEEIVPSPGCLNV